MNIKTEAYLQQLTHWPKQGKAILAQYDTESIIVYQAYKPEIAHYVLQHGKFGGNAFSFERMSWIKTNFLWMMYRSGWGIKAGQEITLALRLKRVFFDELLKQAVPSTFDRHVYTERVTWEAAVKHSSVRLQWDPDHHPFGNKQERRAVQLGLRADALKAFATRELLEVINLSNFVEQQRQHIIHKRLDLLETPAETVYQPLDLIE
jgi:hypothetical protein